MDPVKTTPTFNYTRNAWEGVNYDRNLSLKEIAKKVRMALKEKYPKCKFSITKETYSGGQAMHISLMEAPFKVFTEEGKEYMQLNRYHFEDDDRLTEKARDIIKDVKKLVSSFNFDDSDAMIDYFHCNFYENYSIGKWDKPFKLVK